MTSAAERRANQLFKEAVNAAKRRSRTGSAASYKSARSGSSYKSARSGSGPKRKSPRRAAARPGARSKPLTWAQYLRSVAKKIDSYGPATRKGMNAIGRGTVIGLKAAGRGLALANRAIAGELERREIKRGAKTLGNLAKQRLKERKARKKAMELKRALRNPRRSGRIAQAKAKEQSPKKTRTGRKY